jgi:hypothetical protein
MVRDFAVPPACPTSTRSEKTPRITPSEFDPNLVYERYPAPIALGYEKLAKLRDAHEPHPAAERSQRQGTPLHRMIALVDLFEVTLKYCTIILLRDYLRLGRRSRDVDQALATHLMRPSLGHWNQFLRDTAGFCEEHQGDLFVPELIDFYSRRRQLIDKLVGIRNDQKGHTALAPDEELESAFASALPLLERLLADLEFLADYPLVLRDAGQKRYSYMGLTASVGSGDEATSELTPGHLYLMRDGSALALFPLILLEECVFQTARGTCGERKLFFFNEVVRRRAEFLDYSMNHRRRPPAVAGAVREIISECAQYLKSTLETSPRVLSWELVQEHSGRFVGRVKEEERIVEFIQRQPRGYVTVEGDPGIGKTALMSRLVSDLVVSDDLRDRSPAIVPQIPALKNNGVTVAFHLCLRADQGSLDPQRILSSLAEQLSAQSQTATTPERSPEALLRLARSLTAQHSGKVVIVIEGVDEALDGRTAQERATLLDLLVLRRSPLPPGVFVLLSARRGVLPDLRGGGVPVLGLRLAGLSRQELQELLAHATDGSFLEQANIDAVERVSAGNPLYVRMLADDLAMGRVALQAINRLPEGVEGYFEALLRRLCADSRWPAMRDCLLLLAVAKAALSCAQISEMAGLPGPVVESELTEDLDAILTEEETELGVPGYRLFHGKFREFLLDLFLGRLPRAASRLNRSGRTIDLRGGEAPVEGAQLNEAYRRITNYCRGWRTNEDNYPLQYFTAHLYEAAGKDTNASRELETLVTASEFLRVKLSRLQDSFLAAEDVRYLALILLAGGRDDEVVELAITDHGYQRDGVIAALRAMGSEQSARLVRALLARNAPRRGWIGRFGFPVSARPVPNSIINARRVAIDLAAQHGMSDALAIAANDRSAAVRTLLVPYLYRLWVRDQKAGWQLLERLSDSLCSRGLVNLRLLEACGGMSLAILIYSFEDDEVSARLRKQWQLNVQRARKTAMLSVLQRRLGIFLLTRTLRLLMASQPDFQPLNLRELTASYSRPTHGREKGLEALKDLEEPGRGFEGTIGILLEKNLPFDIYLMLVAERTLVFHGSRDVNGVLRALALVHEKGCWWFRQSILYILFSILNQAERVHDEWLESYARMTRDTVEAEQGTFKTGTGVYTLAPHMAWLEAVFDTHRPSGHARFIPEFYRQSRKLQNAAYTRHVISAANILSFAYRRHHLALDCLDQASTLTEPSLRQLVVEVLANIRFYAEDTVDRFLEEHKDLARRVSHATPSLRSSDLLTFVDEFMNHAMLHSASFRSKIAGVFREAGTARSLSELLQQILNWVMDLLAG